MRASRAFGFPARYAVAKFVKRSPAATKSNGNKNARTRWGEYARPLDLAANGPLHRGCEHRKAVSARSLLTGRFWTAGCGFGRVARQGPNSRNFWASALGARGRTERNASRLGPPMPLLGPNSKGLGAWLSNDAHLTHPAPVLRQDFLAISARLRAAYPGCGGCHTAGCACAPRFNFSGPSV